MVLFNTTAKTGPWLGDIGKSWIKAGSDPEAYYYTTIPIVYSPQFYSRYNDWMTQRRTLLHSVFANKEWMDSMSRLTKSAESHDVLNRLGEIQCPVLVVSCGRDYLTPVQEQKKIVEKLPQGYHCILPGEGHASMYENPVLFSSLVLGFINNPKVQYTILS